MAPGRGAASGCGARGVCVATQAALCKAAAGHRQLVLQLGGSADGPQLREERRRRSVEVRELSVGLQSALLAWLQQAVGPQEQRELERLWVLFLSALELFLQDLCCAHHLCCTFSPGMGGVTPLRTGLGRWRGGGPELPPTPPCLEEEMEQVVGLGEGGDAFIAGHLRAAPSGRNRQYGTDSNGTAQTPSTPSTTTLTISDTSSCCSLRGQRVTGRTGHSTAQHRAQHSTAPGRAMQGNAGRPGPAQPVRSRSRPHLFPTEPRAAVAPASAPLRAAALGTAAGSAFCEAMAVPGRSWGPSALGPVRSRSAPVPLPLCPPAVPPRSRTPF
uniref:Uncharacterized protein n=1 Tax=Coturnix japonica TaxID=93934 RepID=A0A8C2T199_COTJA